MSSIAADRPILALGAMGISSLFPEFDRRGTAE